MRSCMASRERGSVRHFGGMSLGYSALRRIRARYRMHLADRVDFLMKSAEPSDFRDLFADVWLRLQWDRRQTARRLYLLAKNGPGEGEIVEIGSFLGNSTIYLAAGAARRGGKLVHAIDPHSPESMVQLPVSTTDASAQFFENLTIFQLRDQVFYHRKTSVDVAQNWSGGPVRLLYVDGLHTYNAVIGDFSAWHSHLASTYVIVFDDFLWPEVERAVRFLHATHRPKWFAVRGGQAIFSSQPLPIAIAGLP